MVSKLPESVVIVVRDFNGLACETKFETSIHPHTPVKNIIIEVAKYFKYEPDSIRLVYQKDNLLNLSEKTEGSLEEAGLCFEPASRNLFLLTGFNCSKPILRSSSAIEDDLSLGASASPTETCTGELSVRPQGPPVPPLLSSSSRVSNIEDKMTEFYEKNLTSNTLIKHDTEVADEEDVGDCSKPLMSLKEGLNSIKRIKQLCSVLDKEYGENATEHCNKLYSVLENYGDYNKPLMSLKEGLNSVKQIKQLCSVLDKEYGENATEHCNKLYSVLENYAVKKKLTTAQQTTLKDYFVKKILKIVL